MFLFHVFLFYFLFSSVSSCPDGSVPRKPYCNIFNATETGFAKAETICTEIGGHLVAIHDAFLNEFIGEYAADYFHHSSNFWIGANSLNSQNVWEWTDGTDFDFKDWKKGEPQNTSDLFCASESIDYKYWVAESCSAYKSFVCEILNESISTSTKKSITSTLVTTIPTTTSELATPTPINYPIINKCSSGWTYFEQTKSSYCVELFYFRSFSDAEKYCQNYGGHLASIHSDVEKNLINSTICFYQYALWIGLHTTDNGKTYEWTDGSHADNLNWGQGYPNISEGECVIDESYCRSNDTGFFKNYQCYHIYSFVCKKTIADRTL